MQPIKAMETPYKGYRFHSRTEARWAVFYDELGEAWEYELEAFQLNDGRGYWPDFWLPALHRFIEVKRPLDAYPDLSKPITFASEYPIYVFSGAPGNHEITILYHRGKEQVAGTLSTCTRCGHLLIAEYSSKIGWHGYCSACNFLDNDPFVFMDHGDFLIPDLRIRKSIDAARSARFGFGEHGR